MDKIVGLVILSLFLSFIINFIFNKLFLKYNKIDVINQRSSHTTLATKSGGVSMFIELSIITIALYFLNLELYDFSLLLPLGLMFITGVYDDFYNANFKLKFFIQLIVAKLFIDQGFIINNLHGFLEIYEIPNFISQLITALVYLAIVNSINFTDGIDGLASTLILFYLITFENLMGFDSPLFYINFITVFSIIPFQFFNYKKKNKVFLGDAGSLFLGALVFLNMILYLKEGSHQNSINPVLISLTILIYPLLDLTRVFFLRIINGKSPFIADKNHLHHRLSTIFRSHFQISIIITLLNFVFFICIVFLELNFKSIYSIIIYLILTFSILKIK